LQSLLAYARGAGVDNRWLVIEGNSEFFAVTKRIHNYLHGSPGDGGALGDAEREIYEAVAERNARDLAHAIRQGDVVFLHDPQTADLARTLRDAGAHVVWRCHVGVDRPNELTKLGWDFVRPYVEEADSYVFSRREFVWERLAGRKVWVVAPSIDVFSPKNQELESATVNSILHTAGLRDSASAADPVFTSTGAREGSTGGPSSTRTARSLPIRRFSPRSPGGTGSRTPRVSYVALRSTAKTPSSICCSAVPRRSR
jgi:trehalose synthase